MALLAFLAGLVLLALAGDQLVNGAVAIARRLDVPSLIIGLTIVAIGTSMPELVVAVEAALQNHPELAVGGVVGSNISNALLIIGLPALVTPFGNEDKLTRRTGLIMLLVTALFILAMWDGQLDQIEGVGAHVVDERGLRHHLLFADVELLGDDLDDLLLDAGHLRPRPGSFWPSRARRAAGKAGTDKSDVR